MVTLNQIGVWNNKKRVDSTFNLQAAPTEDGSKKTKREIEAKKEEFREGNGFYSAPPLSPEQKGELMKRIEGALTQ